jgi:hypothetical protein
MAYPAARMARVSVITTPVMGGSRGKVQGVRTSPFRPKVPFFVEGCNFQTKILPRKGTRSLHNNKIFPRNPEKPCFFATRKDVESYTQMSGKRILALEFSN